jgi:hypothetical protein
MELNELGYSITSKGVVIVRAIGLVVPLERCETLSTQKTYIWSAAEESWMPAKVFFDAEDTLHIECPELRLIHLFKKNDIKWWCSLKNKRTLTAIDATSRELIECMVSQFETNRKKAKRTLRKS